METLHKGKSNGEKQGRKREQRKYTFQCECPGTMLDWVEEEGGDWMRIAHSAIIAKLIQCLREWEKAREQRDRKRTTQEERRLAEMVGGQLRELEKFEAENENRYCDINVWMISENRCLLLTIASKGGQGGILENIPL